MKKFSKVLTGVLSALLLTLGGVNFTSCSNDDGDDTPKNPSLTIAAEASEGQVTAGGVITTTITATLKDTTFKGPIAKDASLNDYVDITYSGDTDFVGNPTLTAVEAIANGATVAKVKLVQTAAAVTQEKSGTISVKIKASALASGKDLTAGNTLPYKISAATPAPAPTPAKATAKTYNFVGLGASDFKDSTGAAVAAWGAGASWAASATIGLPAGETSVAGATAHCKAQTDASNQNLIRARTDADQKTTALNFNGGGSADISSGATIADQDRYISIPVDGAGSVTASVKFVGSSGKTGNLQAALFDADGKLLGTVVTAAAGDGKITGTDAVTGTISGSTTAATTVYLIFSRNGAAGGGMDLYKIEVTPAN